MKAKPNIHIMTVKEFEAHFANIEPLIIDASEQAIQRPDEQETQETYYSGKKRHALKTMIISTKSKFINYISYCREGT